MKLHRKYKFAILGVAVFCTAVSSSALTLGRARGNVLLGQALQLTVPIRLESGEGASALCFEADVFYGETRQDASRVGVTSEFSSQSRSVNVSVTSLANVDEPVVTVYFRAGCESKTTRRYVLLADLSSEVTPQLKTAPPPISISQARPTREATSSDLSLGTDAAAARSSKNRQAVLGEGRPQVKAKRSALGIESRRPRLQLAPVDLTEVRDPTLKLSHELLLEGTEDLEKRAQAQALWRSLNASLQDVQRAESRRISLETDLKTLHDTTTRNRSLLRELGARLDQAESERYANPLVLGLVGAWLACALGLAYAWRHMRRVGLSSTPWWRDEGVGARSVIASAGEKDEHREVHGELKFSHGTDKSPGVSSDAASEKSVTGVQEVGMDIQMPDSLVSTPKSTSMASTRDAVPALSKTSPNSTGHVDFSNSLTATIRSISTQEMLNVRQQAEFFMTLGQHEEAIKILGEIINTGVDSNPLVYLDLLKILHTLGRKTEYERYRNGFNAIFSGRVPAYTDFNERDEGLEAYPEVCLRIAALWPSEEVITYIEDSLVRAHDDIVAAQVFNLEAFRDLLMLHGVARRIVSSLDSGLLPFSTARAGSAETGASFIPDRIDHSPVAEDTPPVSRLLGPQAPLIVDFDLSEPIGNLIDFDVADYVPPTGGKQPRPD